jgi:hypothetical protein
MNNQDKEFSELVGEALGRASVAWSELPTGIFDSNTCCALHREIMNAHDSLIKKIKDKEELEKERERSEILFEAVKKCNDDHWFMINLIERYSSDKEQALKDCLERMKFRKTYYEKTLEKYGGEV